ncbi:MAG: PrgI family protein [Candidatus Zambryskibacteria bacterium]|nr:PrgI family protein [Candidatus Zambryskibacteria bacterium]
MRFQVPQFIEIEDKIVGPLTLKQFLYLAGGAGMSIVAYNFLPLVFSVIVIASVGALSLALAFYKHNNKPFVDLLEAGIMYYMGEKLYIWKKRDRVIETKNDVVAPAQVYVPRLSDSKLKELTWSLDINESSNPITRGEKGDKFQI